MVGSPSACGTPSSSGGTVASFLSSPVIEKPTAPTALQTSVCKNTTSTIDRCTFSSATTLGSMLAACAASTDDKAFGVPSDSLASTFYSLGSSSTANGNVQCWYAALRGGADSVKFTTTTSSANLGGAIFELTPAALPIGGFCSAGTGTSTAFATASQTVHNHPYFIAIISSTTAQANFIPGTNFNALATGDSQVNLEYSGSTSISSPTTFPASNSNSVVFAELGCWIPNYTSTGSVTLKASTTYLVTAKVVIATSAGGPSLLWAISPSFSAASTVLSFCGFAPTTSATTFSENCASVPTWNAAVTSGLPNTALTTITKTEVVLVATITTGASAETFGFCFYSTSSAPGSTGWGADSGTTIVAQPLS